MPSNLKQVAMDSSGRTRHTGHHQQNTEEYNQVRNKQMRCDNGHDAQQYAAEGANGEERLHRRFHTGEQPSRNTYHTGQNKEAADDLNYERGHIFCLEKEQKTDAQTQETAK